MVLPDVPRGLRHALAPLPKEEWLMVSHWPARNSGANRQIGPTEQRVLIRAHNSRSGQVVIEPKRDNALWCAAKRLTQRGLLERQRFGGDDIGWITVYKITERGTTKLKEYGLISTGRGS